MAAAEEEERGAVGEGRRREGRNNGEWGDVELRLESGFYSDFRAWARESEINTIFSFPLWGFIFFNNVS